jgi:hypothetical protein
MSSRDELTLEQIMQEGCEAMAQMVADSNALNRAWRNGRYDDELTRLRTQVLDADRNDSGTPEPTGNDAGPV